MEFGKFSDATSLFEGYLNLEKAYTKKCQEAKALKGKLDDLNLANAGESDVRDKESEKASLDNAIDLKACEVLSGEEKMPNSLKSDDLKVSDPNLNGERCLAKDQEQLSENETDGKIYDTKSVEIGLDKDEKNDIENRESSCSERFKSPEWRKSVTKFFAVCPEAKSLGKEIGRVILSDKTLQNAENCLEIAFERVKANRPASIMGNNKPDEQPAKSQAQSDEVDPNKEITLSEYLRLVAERKVNAPKFLTDAVGGRTIGLTPQRKINSLAEAGEYLMKNYFK